MTNAAHMSGPWIHEYNPYTAQDGKEIPAFQVHGEEKVCEINEDRPVEEQEANARLIAAAPELLAVAEFALDHLQGQDYLQACAIIAKAKGGAA
jgi:hypothetical protein